MNVDIENFLYRSAAGLLRKPGEALYLALRLYATSEELEPEEYFIHLIISLDSFDKGLKKFNIWLAEAPNGSTSTLFFDSYTYIGASCYFESKLVRPKLYKYISKAIGLLRRQNLHADISINFSIERFNLIKIEFELVDSRKDLITIKEFI